MRAETMEAQSSMYLPGLALPLVAVAPRMLGFMGGLQLLPSAAFPALLRNGLALAMALAVYPLAAEDALLRDRDMLWWTMIMAKEALLGLVLGTLLGLPLALFEGLGALIDNQSGANSSSVYNPLAEAELGVWAGLLRMMGATLIVSTGLLAASVELGLWSYRAWPVSALAPPITIDAAQALGLFQRFMEKLLLLAFPVVFVLMLLELAVGRMARPVPQLNIFTVAMPVKAVAAVIVLMIELVFLLDGVVDLLRFPLVAVCGWMGP